MHQPKELKRSSAQMELYTRGGLKLTWGELDEQIKFQKEAAKNKLKRKRYI